MAHVPSLRRDGGTRRRRNPAPASVGSQAARSGARRRPSGVRTPRTRAVGHRTARPRGMRCREMADARAHRCLDTTGSAPGKTRGMLPPTGARLAPRALELARQSHSTYTKRRSWHTCSAEGRRHLHNATRWSSRLGRSSLSARARPTRLSAMAATARPALRPPARRRRASPRHAPPPGSRVARRPLARRRCRTLSRPRVASSKRRKVPRCRRRPSRRRTLSGPAMPRPHGLPGGWAKRRCWQGDCLPRDARVLTTPPLAVLLDPARKSQAQRVRHLPKLKCRTSL